MDLRIHKNCPKCGAAMVEHNIVQLSKRGTHAQCRRCKADYQRHHQRCKKYRRRGLDTPLAYTTTVVDYAETILRLVEERDRCATHWEREEVTRRINELLANRSEDDALAGRGGAQ